MIKTSMEPIVSPKEITVSSESKTYDSTDYSRCLICQKETTETTHNLTINGLPKFQAALDQHKDEVHKRLCIDMQNQTKFISQHPRCHPKCKNRYMLKSKIQVEDSRQKKRALSPLSATLQSPNRIKKPDNKKECFLCGKERDSKGLRELIWVRTCDKQDSIHQKAKELKDDELLTKIMGYGDTCIDMIAADFRYHRYCNQKFFFRKSISGQSAAADDDGDMNNQSVFDKAFEELVAEISDRLLNEKCVFYMTQLLNRYRTLLSEGGAENSKLYRNRGLKKRLISYFESSIHIIPQKDNSSLVCSSTLTVGEMCTLASQLRIELEESCIDIADEFEECSDDENDDINMTTESYMLAKYFNAEIKKIKQGKPMNIVDNSKIEISFQKGSELIPNHLYNFIAWMVTNADEPTMNNTRVKLSVSLDEKVINMCQELIFAATNTQTPKHVGLALHVLKQTRSKGLVTMLNRFGHTISYDDAQRYITAMADLIDRETEENGVFIPSGLKPGHFTQCAFDNLDFHEHTKDGTTLHATSHNIYQYQHTASEEKTCTIPFKATSKGLKSVEELHIPTSNVYLKERRLARSILGTLDNTTVDTNLPELLLDDTFLWCIIRQHGANEDNDQIPTPYTWNGYFEKCLQASVKDKTTIEYGPIFPHSPTSADVVQASVDYLITVTRKMHQRYTVITCDQAIYDIVKGIIAKHPIKYAEVIVRLGGFHISENYMGAIGYFMKGSGIEEILSESGVCLSGTANKVISGKDYYKMVRCHSLVCEAMINLAWSAFRDWVSSQHNESSDDNLMSLSTHIESLQQYIEESELEALQTQTTKVKDDLKVTIPVWRKFVEQLSTTGKYWLMYIEMVLVVKRYIHAERAGNWQEHLDQVKHMIPYIVSAGHTKYMSCLPIYLKDMTDLPQTHPELYDIFMNGDFNVRQTPGAFNGVWTDMALEQTYNREGKTSLLKGISLNPSARDKYIKTAPFMTKVSEAVKYMAHVDSQTQHHHGESKLQSQSELKIVTKIQEIVTEKMVDPFHCNTQDDLINIFSGEKNKTNDLIHAREKGLQSIKDAKEAGASKIKVPSINTFISKKSKSVKKAPITQMFQDESAVTRALCFIQGADVETRTEAFSHEWTQYPSSLFKPDADSSHGFSMRKGTKSDFLALLLARVDNKVTKPDKLPVSNLPTCYMIDAMAFIQRFQQLNAKQFRDLPKKYIEKILEMKPNNCHNINIVGDRYDFDPAMSLKGDERVRRDASLQRVKQYSPSDLLDIPVWKDLLSHSSNKSRLLQYISEYWVNHNNEVIPEDLTLILGGTFQCSDKTMAVRKNSATRLVNLSCKEHEEADTRIFAHLAYCVNDLGCKRAVIACTDTDIIILCMYYYCMLPITEIWVEKSSTFLPIHIIVDELALKYEKNRCDLVNTLLSTYVLSGCDSTSYLYRRGKRTAAIVALNLIGQLPNISSAHEIIELSDSILCEARLYFVQLYGQDNFDSLDTLRQHLFASSHSDLRALPPTEDAFYFHVLRSLYQIALYQRAYLPKPSLPPVVQFGRTMDKGKCIPILQIKPAKPNVKNTSCKCKTSKCLLRCSCARAGVPCFIGCSCLGSKERCLRLANSDLESSSEDEQ